MKKIVVLALAAGAALFLRRQQQSRPAADVWRDATATAPPAPRTPTVALRERVQDHPT